MEYVRFVFIGMKVSRICLGCVSYGGPTERWPWALDEETGRPSIKRALELGVHFFDTADVYSSGRSEEILGKKHILSAIDASLTRLGTDYVDLYQIYR